MISLSYPEILLMLYFFKTTDNKEIPKNLVAYLLNNSTEINFDLIIKLLYDNNKNKRGMSQEEMKKNVINRMDEEMHVNIYKDDGNVLNRVSCKEFFDQTEGKNFWMLEMNENPKNKKMKKELLEEKKKIVADFVKEKKKILRKKSKIGEVEKYVGKVKDEEINALKITERDNQVTKNIKNKKSEKESKLSEQENGDFNIDSMKKSGCYKKIKIKRKDNAELESLDKIDKITESEADHKKTKIDIKKEKQKPVFMNITESFNLIKKERIVEPEKDLKLRFQPLIKKSDITFKYKHKRFMKYFSTRRKKEISNPTKITFIKFHDQIRPPFYGFIQKSKSRITHKKINLVDDYDKDSDENWILEEGDSIESSETESEESLETSENDFIDNDGTPVIEKRVYKKPEIDFKTIKFDKFKEFDDKWLEIPILRRNFLPDDLKGVFSADFDAKKNIDDFIKTFGLKYRIQNSVIVKEIKQLKKKENLKVSVVSN